MRSPVESTPLTRMPPGERLPSGPPRDSMGLPLIPLPDVVFNPIAERAQGKRETGTGLGVAVDAEGGMRFREPLPDLTALAERVAGNDPFSHEKRKVAEATFEERLCLAREAALRRQQAGLFHLKERLEHVNQLPNLSGSEKRELLFDMWDECVEGAADGQPDLGAAARASIVAFIRRVFPAGSPQAFTPAELATLNRRRVSRPPFDPYAPSRPDAGAP